MRGIGLFFQARFVWLCIAAYGFGIGLHAYAFLRSGEITALGWRITQYQINYFEFGFTKRATIGTLFYPVFERLRDGGLAERLVVVALDFATFCLMVWIVKRALDSLGERHGAWTTALRALIVLSPLGAIQWGYEVGRYDHFNFVLVAAALYAAQRARPLAAGLVLLVAVLTHEAVFFYGLPAVLAYLLARGASLAGLSMAAVPSAIGMALVAAFGNIDPAALAALPAEADGGIGAWNRGVISIPDNLQPFDYLALVLYLSATCALLTTVRMAGGRPEALRLLALVPLALFLLGFDYFRWIALVFACLCFCLVPLVNAGYAVAQLPVGRARLPGLFLMVPLGPIGVASALPYVNKVVLEVGEAVGW